MPPENPRPSPPGQDQRRLAVIMFTDMVGYSALSQRDEALALHLLEEHRRIVRPLLAPAGGREIKTIGDAFLIEFSSALAAVTCAIAIQRALHERNLAAAPDHRVQIRIGLHAGDVVHRENDVYGDGVNIASRIEPLAEAGGICVSEDVARQIRNQADCPLVKLGSGDLKNIAMPVDIYRVLLPWTKARLPLADRLAFLLRKKSARRFLGAAVLALAAGAVLHFRTTGMPPAAPAPSNRLAVLPFVNFSKDAQDEYFADGMTEELISSLSTIRELSVIARTSIARFKGTQLDIPQIGSALNVGSILEGTIRVAGDEARINVSLIDVATQKTLWSQEFTRLIKDVFAVQSAIAQSVTEALKVQLLAGEKTLIDRRGSRNNEASRQYLLGQSHLNHKTGDEVVLAIDCFNHAVTQDPTFALAYARLAECYTLAGSAGYTSLPRAQAIDQARAFAHRALELDESLAEAHAALAYVKFRIDWDWTGAETEFKRALELKPDARTHEVYGLYLAIQKRFDEAMLELRRAQQLDPLSPSVSNGIGRLLHFENKFDEALLQYKKTLELDPQYAEAYFSMGMSYVVQQRYDDAITAMQTAIRLSGNRLVMVSMLGLTEARAGHLVEARRILADLQELSRKTTVSPYYFGIILIGLGEFDRAFEYLDQAYAERDGIMIYLAVDPITRPAMADPRFIALIKKIGLKQ